MAGKRTLQTAIKYRNEVAEQYEQTRKCQDKWKAEERVLGEMLNKLPPGLEVIDVPVGTGRFFHMYLMRQYKVDGVDISLDMLNQAKLKGPYEGIELKPGNIFKLKVEPNTYDLAISIRIMNLIDPEDTVKALQELQRVTRKNIIFNLRVTDGTGRYKNARDFGLVEQALFPDWRIAENVEIHEPDFRMIRLCSS